MTLLTKTAGSWDAEPTATIATQWQHSATEDGTFEGISGATGNTLETDDYPELEGRYVRVQETATNVHGSATAVSAAVGPVVPAGYAPVNVTPPSIVVGD